jgi:hypothetical protein
MTIRKDHKRKILKFRCFYRINFPSRAPLKLMFCHQTNKLPWPVTFFYNTDLVYCTLNPILDDKITIAQERRFNLDLGNIKLISMKRSSVNREELSTPTSNLLKSGHSPCKERDSIHSDPHFSFRTHLVRRPRFDVFKKTIPLCFIVHRSSYVNICFPRKQDQTSTHLCHLYLL